VEEATEQEIALAKAQIGAEGIGCEPASAVTLAGLKKFVAQGKITPEERVVIVLTGHTLKDSDYTIQYHRGELLTAEENAEVPDNERAEHAALLKPPLVLEADTDVVLRELETRMNVARVAQPV
jgi:threonine synthase